MMLYRYGRWDATQAVDPFNDLMEHLADRLLERGDLQSALRDMLQRGVQFDSGRRMGTYATFSTSRASDDLDGQGRGERVARRPIWGSGTQQNQLTTALRASGASLLTRPPDAVTETQRSAFQTKSLGPWFETMTNPESVVAPTFRRGPRRNPAGVTRASGFDSE